MAVQEEGKLAGSTESGQPAESHITHNEDVRLSRWFAQVRLLNTGGYESACVCRGGQFQQYLGRGEAFSEHVQLCWQQRT